MRKKVEKTEWRTVEYLPDDIQVSREGVVRQVLDSGEEIIKEGSVSGGQRMISVKGKQYAIHRLVADAFLPNPDSLPRVIHKDGNKLNNSIDNLKWASRGESITNGIKEGSSGRDMIYCEETDQLYASMRSAAYSTLIPQDILSWAVSEGIAIIGHTFRRTNIDEFTNHPVLYFSFEDAKDAFLHNGPVDAVKKLNQNS